MATSAINTTQIDQLHRDGFTTFDAIVDGDGLDDLRHTYDRILAGEVDCGSSDRQLGGITRQVMIPSRHDTSIQRNPAYLRANELASELLGLDAEYAFDMMIYKPAGHPEATPWHQDLSYFKMPFTRAGMLPVNFTVQFWIAVDDADEENGCMHFVPGMHEKPMPEHYVFSGAEDYEGRLLAMKDPDVVMDLSTVVPCPLAAGGATAHIEGAPHYTPPNRSADRQRRAYIVNFRDPAKGYPPG